MFYYSKYIAINNHHLHSLFYFLCNPCPLSPSTTFIIKSWDMTHHVYSKFWAINTTDTTIDRRCFLYKSTGELWVVWKLFYAGEIRHFVLGTGCTVEQPLDGRCRGFDSLTWARGTIFTNTRRSYWTVWMYCQRRPSSRRVYWWWYGSVTTMVVLKRKWPCLWGSMAIESQIRKKVLIPTYKNIGGRHPDQIHRPSWSQNELTMAKSTLVGGGSTGRKWSIFFNQTFRTCCG